MLWLATLALATPLEVEADPTYEALSVIAYLAEYEEFCRSENKGYVKAVDAHFRAHREHEAVELAKELRKKQLIGFNALSDLAAHVNADFEPIVALSPRPARLDPRWGENPQRTARFLEAAGRFAEDADFEGFWAAQKGYVDAVEARFADRLGDKDVVGWFDETFGPVEGASYRVVPGLLTGQNNYGTSVDKPDGTVTYRPALGMWDLDDDELPEVDRSHEFVLVHEFGHAYGTRWSTLTSTCWATGATPCTPSTAAPWTSRPTPRAASCWGRRSPGPSRCSTPPTATARRRGRSSSPTRRGRASCGPPRSPRSSSLRIGKACSTCRRWCRRFGTP